jgi:6-phosphogluconolactonase
MKDIVPADDPRSNYHMARETLISQVPIPAQNVHPIPTNLIALLSSVRTRTSPNSGNFSAPSRPHLTCSSSGSEKKGTPLPCFPGSPVLDEKLLWVAAVRVAAEPPQRITLTPVVLNQGS